MSRHLSRFSLWLLTVLLALLAACGAPAAPSAPTKPPLLLAQGALVVSVAVPVGAAPGLQDAAADLAQVLAARSGQPERAVVLGAATSAPTAVVVAVELDPNAPAAWTDQGYAIDRHAWSASRHGLRVRARHWTGGMYGLFAVAQALGVQWHHPEETWLPPADVTATLPWDFAGKPETPRFALRGLHEHTQHPIEASDWYLRPGDPALRAMASRYLRWLARNRNNLASFHLLKTVDLGKWTPYAQDLAQEAHRLGIQLGVVTSFADEQQHNYKHIDQNLKGPDGAVVADDVQIRASLDKLAAAGLDFVVLQIGTSEFTKPEDARVLAWLDTTTNHLAQKHPHVRPWVWIHTTCGLHDEQGQPFYHLPRKASPKLGFWVHTTMFYDLEHPAPVYGCQNFHAQHQLLKAELGKRPMAYFPESAWWLGFDSNLPLALPITGWSRAHDLQLLPATGMEAHVTFSTGREWGYWQYDHYVLQAGWQAGLGWQAYLDRTAPLFGNQGAKVAQVLWKWSLLQKKHLYDEDPDRIFYLAGELAQDEIGESAGILARRPKPAFAKVLAYPPAAWQTWLAQYEALVATRPAYAALLADLPPATSATRPVEQKLLAEAREVLELYVLRLDHVRELYAAVVAMRPWREAVLAAGTGGEPPQAVREAAMAKAQAHIQAAGLISQAVVKRLQAAETRYRYPVALLARPKPETLTSYPFGYLEQTSTGHFWVRRDEQLKTLFAKTFGTAKDAWPGAKPAQVYVFSGEGMDLLAPKSAVAGGILGGFLPRYVLGVDAANPGLALRMGQDRDENGLPDGGEVQAVTLTAKDGAWQGTKDLFVIDVFDSAGASLGILALLNADFRAEAQDGAKAAATLSHLELGGQTSTPAFVAMMRQVGGIDQAGAEALLAGVFGLPKDKPLPAQLTVRFRFSLKGL